MTNTSLFDNFARSLSWLLSDTVADVLGSVYYQASLSQFAALDGFKVL